MVELNRTHDAARRSLVEAANAPDADFPLQNLPFGVFSRGDGAPRIGVAIGDRILDLAAAREAGLLDGLDAPVAEALAAPVLNPLMALGLGAASALRARVFDLLDADSPARSRLLEGAALLVPMSEARMHLPTRVGDFTDFLTSGHHSTRLSPTKALAANFMSMPIAYHSRASSVRVTGGQVLRPNVQSRGQDEVVRFGPSTQLDYELELGAFVGPGNALGQPVALDAAAGHLFGYCLLNDWSVRDVQRWESAPLGPFLAKSLSTTISPWVVTEEALRPFRAPALKRAEGEPAPLPHLFSEADQAEGGLDLALYASVTTPAMRRAGTAPARLTDTNFRHMYWTFAQMLTHHASNGCNLQPGDLLGSGTTSGPTPESRACLAEINDRGRVPIALPGGETRTWLEDGDEVVFSARAERQGYVGIGFGECRGTIGPAPAWPKS